jgi:Domain of unknown function (DUF5615)
MPDALRLLIDENLDHRILRGLKLRLPSLDYIIAQATELKGVDDLELLAWAAEHDRVLVTHDLKTIPRYAYERVEAGRSMPGVIAVPDDLPVGQAIEEMVIIIECCAATEFKNAVFYLPV